MNDSPNHTLCYFELPAKSRLADATGGVKSANGANLVNFEFGRTGLFSTRVSPFLDHVRNVVSLRSEEEMLDVDAGRIITAMENKQAVGDGAMSKLPGHPMGTNVPAPLTPNMDEAVTKIASKSIPQNAASFRGQAEMLLKSHTERSSLPGNLTRLGTESPIGGIAEPVAWSLKHGRADFTFTRNPCTFSSRHDRSLASGCVQSKRESAISPCSFYSRKR